jgi:hypothetical protein
LIQSISVRYDREKSSRIPGDIAVAGFDDIPAAQFVHPTVKTIAQHPERLNGTAPDHGRCEEMPFEPVCPRIKLMAAEPVQMRV